MTKKTEKKSDKNSKEKSHSKKLTEHEDYYFNKDGLMVFTEQYHLKRGYCCQNSCTHCPYEKVSR